MSALFADAELLLADLKRPIEPSPQQRQLCTLLAAFKRGEHLTVGIALGKYGVYALSQRVGELKRLDWPIKSRMIRVRYTTHAAEYWLPEEWRK